VRELRDKVAVITGGASGIGRAMAERLAEDGVRLVLADIEEPVLAETTAALEAAGARVIGVPTDVSDLGSVQSLAERALSEFGAVHIVCNNAGVAVGSALEATIEEWRWLLGVNLWGVIHGCHVFVPLLRAQNEGHVVNTGSVAGIRGVGVLGAYCTSKFAVVGLSESIQMELVAAGSAVRVSVLCPGFVQTRIFESRRNMPASVLADRATRGLEEPPSFDAAIAFGIPAAEVGAAVHEAIVTERFYVLTHPGAVEAGMHDRLAWITEGGPMSPTTMEQTVL
jgi:NAD(P)-dependent dehydrogenase (short-subunit alcohol dehydrogenase family)